MIEYESYTNSVGVAVNFLQTRLPLIPKTLLILGTGLGKIIEGMKIEIEIPYSEIPGFPVSTVESHAGLLLVGSLNSEPLVVMKGRFHYYEGYDMKQITFPIRVLGELGIKNLMVTNVAGALNSDFLPGEIMFLNDHINLLPDNPLRGRNVDKWGSRFPDMFHCYDKKLIHVSNNIASGWGQKTHNGVYVAVAGPNLETPAEYRFLRAIGADCVGMSTVPEVIVGVHMGLRIWAASIISDVCYEPGLKPVSLKEILENADKGADHIIPLIYKLTEYINKHDPE